MGPELRSFAEKEMLTILESSVQQTFQTFLGCTPEIVNISDNIAKQKINTFEARSISGSVAFLQKNFEGTLSIGFTRESALKLFKSFYKEDLCNVDDVKVIEGIAELANVIHGLVKEHMNIKGYNFQMCLPVVVIGKNHAIFAQRDCDGVAVLFKTEFGDFFVEVLSQKKFPKNLNEAV